jgi:hypothetical protein
VFRPPPVKGWGNRNVKDRAPVLMSSTRPLCSPGCGPRAPAERRGPTGDDPQRRRVALGRGLISRDGPRGGMACVCSHPVGQVRSKGVGVFLSARALVTPVSRVAVTDRRALHPLALFTHRRGMCSTGGVAVSRDVGELAAAWGNESDRERRE